MHKQIMVIGNFPLHIKTGRSVFQQMHLLSHKIRSCQRSLISREFMRSSFITPSLFLTQMMKCGDYFTLTGTDEDTIYFWGSMPNIHTPAMECCDEIAPRSDETLEKKHRRNVSASLSSGASESVTTSPR